MSEKNRNIKYALSIFLKFGEVLHVEGVDRETRDRYFELARRPDASMLVEDKSNVRNILGRDIANISSLAYDATHERVIHPLRKMLLSESSFGKSWYITAIKLFVFLAVVAILAQFGIAAANGTLVSNIGDMKMIGRLIGNGMIHVRTIFGITIVLMYLLALTDMVLGLSAHYHINRAGAEPVHYPRYIGLVITTVFFVVFQVIQPFFMK